MARACTLRLVGWRVVVLTGVFSVWTVSAETVLTWIVSNRNVSVRVLSRWLLSWFLLEDWVVLPVRVSGSESVSDAGDCVRGEWWGWFRCAGGEDGSGGVVGVAGGRGDGEVAACDTAACDTTACDSTACVMTADSPTSHGAVRAVAAA
jgi:hypothetical protein